MQNKELAHLGPAPDGGRVAWSQVFASFIISMCTIGVTNSFGCFQSYYETSLSASSSKIAWIGTTQGLLLNFVGLLSGRLYDLGYTRALMCTGTLLSFIGFLSASFAKTFPTTFFSLGLCIGLAVGFIYVPSLAVVVSYFDRRRSLAVGIAVTGSGTGGVLYPILFRAVVDSAGFAWALRTFALMNGGLLLLATWLIRPRVTRRAASQPGEREKLLDGTAFRDAPFLLFSTAMFLLWLSIDVPYFFLPSFVAEKLRMSVELGDYLVSALNGASIAGMVLLGLLAVYANPILVWQGSILASATLMATWLAVTNLAACVAFAVLYGFCTGGVLTLVMPVLASISPDGGLVGTRLGMSGVFSGIGYLVGAPIAGTIERTAAGRVGLCTFLSSTYMGAFLAMGLVALISRRSKVCATAVGCDVSSESSGEITSMESVQVGN